MAEHTKYSGQSWPWAIFSAFIAHVAISLVWICVNLNSCINCLFFKSLCLCLLGKGNAHSTRSALKSRFYRVIFTRLHWFRGVETEFWNTMRLPNYSAENCKITLGWVFIFFWSCFNTRIKKIVLVTRSDGDVAQATDCRLYMSNLCSFRNADQCCWCLC